MSLPPYGGKDVQLQQHRPRNSHSGWTEEWGPVTTVKGNVSAEQAVASNERLLSPRAQEALGELVGVAQEGLLALSVGLGLGVLAELMEEVGMMI